ncbi:hypothetical protein D3C78_449850 [compost metagenome]
MTSGVLFCDGSVSLTPDGAPVCSGAWTLQPVLAPFDPAQLDPAMIAEAFGAGFTLVGSIWIAGWACRQLLNMIR